MKLGLFTPVFGGIDTPAMLAKVCALKHVKAIEFGTGGWPGRDHIDPDGLLAVTAAAKTCTAMVADAGLTSSAHDVRHQSRGEDCTRATPRVSRLQRGDGAEAAA